MADNSETGGRGYKLERIREQEKMIAAYQQKLKDNPADADTAVTIMTLQVALEELKKES